MNVHAQAMPQAMGKKTAETGVLDDGAGFGVDISGLDPRANRRDPALLRRPVGVGRVERRGSRPARAREARMASATIVSVGP